MTNLRRPAVSHTNTDHVLMIRFILESVWRIIGALWGKDKDLFVCVCRRVFLAGLLAAAGTANDTVACLPPDSFVCFGVGGAYGGLKE